MKRSLLLLVPVLTLAACSPVFYSPSFQHVPLLTAKEEFTASGGYVGAESTEGLALKAAYAISPHWGLVAGGNLSYGGKAGDGTAHGAGGFFEAGAGYFKKVSNKFVFETYGLVGIGGMKNRFPGSLANYPETDGEIRASILMGALQPSFGFKSRYFEAALSCRAAMINYTNIRGNLMRQNIDQEAVGNQQRYLADHRSNVLLEPALTVRGGLEFLKLEAQAGGSLNLSNRNFPQDGSWVSLGLLYRFPGNQKRFR